MGTTQATAVDTSIASDAAAVIATTAGKTPEAEVTKIYYKAYEMMTDMASDASCVDMYESLAADYFEYEADLDSIEASLDAIRTALVLARRYRADPRVAALIDLGHKNTEARGKMNIPAPGETFAEHAARIEAYREDSSAKYRAIRDSTPFDEIRAEALAYVAGRASRSEPQ